MLYIVFWPARVELLLPSSPQPLNLASHLHSLHGSKDILTPLSVPSVSKAGFLALCSLHVVGVVVMVVGVVVVMVVGVVVMVVGVVVSYFYHI